MICPVFQPRFFWSRRRRSQALRSAGIGASGHGFRSSFKDWASAARRGRAAVRVRAGARRGLGDGGRLRPRRPAGEAAAGHATVDELHRRIALGRRQSLLNRRPQPIRDCNFGARSVLGTAKVSDLDDACIWRELRAGTQWCEFGQLICEGGFSVVVAGRRLPGAELWRSLETMRNPVGGRVATGVLERVLRAQRRQHPQRLANRPSSGRPDEIALIKWSNAE